MLRRYSFVPLRAFRRVSLPRIVTRATMTLRTTHEERTAAEPREVGIHAVTLAEIDRKKGDVRLLRLKPLLPKTERSMKARTFDRQYFPQLTAYVYSIVSSRPMARCTYPRSPTSRRIYDHF